MNIMWFCIPAFGHTNPTIEVVREMVKRGHRVRYYSFTQFEEKIRGTGAEFVNCDRYLPEISERQMGRLRKVSTTEMTLQSIRTTAMMDEMIGREVKEFKPDLVVSDSVSFWGKLTAQKYSLPIVCSTTTFAFNRYSSGYLKYSFREMMDIIFGTGKVTRELKKLNALGYHTTTAMDLVQNGNDTDTIVYASRKFQPASETFDAAHYCFAGPSVREVPLNRKLGRKPLVYVSLGTVINDHPDFYEHCIAALKDENVRLLISCGTGMDPKRFGTLPENVRVEQSVDQLSVLAEADLFITHCGMNSASEGLYMGVPEILFPLTGEQQAVARRVREIGAGVEMDKQTAGSAEGLKRFITEALKNESIKKAAAEARVEFHTAGGARAAADFIEKRAAGK